MSSSFVLIIGAMKCGTTTLFSYLAQHPKIAASRGKELHFFAFEETWALGLDWYEQQFDFDPAKHRYRLEASTDQTKYPFCTGTADRIKASAPREFKLIYIMRHPLRRIESHARHAARTHKEVGQCLSPRPDHSLDSGVSPVSLATSRYAQQLDQFHEFYKNGDLFLLTLEALSNNPAELLKEICLFLGLDADVDFDTGSARNRADEMYFTHPIWKRASNIAVLNRITKAVVPERVRKSIWRKTSLRMSDRLNGRFCLTHDEEAALLTMLSPDLVRLRDEYGIDIERQWGIRV